MTLEERLNILVELGIRLTKPDEYLDAVINRSYHHNLWFTEENSRKSLDAIAASFLEESKLRAFVDHYKLDNNIKPLRVGIIMAGNIPVVGFHDFLCTFLSGHVSLLKLSDKDPYLFPCLIKMMTSIDERVSDYVEVIGKLENFDAVIATGSNNTARYFNSYFEKYPHIIRKNRNSVAVLTGKEMAAELELLAHDILNYFGLGCRNVSKIYIPKGYDFNPLMEIVHEHKQIILHSKYKNNFDYNYAIASLNSQPVVMNGCLILLENDSLTSRIASLHYSFYEDANVLQSHLLEIKEQIQCVVAKEPIPEINFVDFGQTQRPGLRDYADGVDTMDMLLALS